jgi:hypothetical protein
MQIIHVGNSTLHTPSRDLFLKNVLHVPSSKKNLVSIHRFTRDNHVFIEYHPYFFLVKDPSTKKVLLHGRCRGGLYPFPSLEHSSLKCVLSVVKPSLSHWHERLGHPSMIIVQKVLDKNKLACSCESSPLVVCDACQCAKSHQLPFSSSNNVLIAPLELVFSNVWGPAPNSIGRNRYYMSFIDDYSKFTWAFLLKHKSEVFAKFHTFQQHVERTLNRKIILIQTDWGAGYQKLNPFFARIGISHCVSCPHTHQQNGVVECKHRHIVDVGLSLLSHANMPLKFWDEAYLTVTFLINCTPSRVIGYQKPMERLFGQTPPTILFSTHLDVCAGQISAIQYSEACVPLHTLRLLGL